MATVPVEDVYAQIVGRLPLAERLRLARMILNSIPPEAVIDYQDRWSEEDIHDVSLASLQHATRSLEGEELDASGR